MRTRAIETPRLRLYPATTPSQFMVDTLNNNDAVKYSEQRHSLHSIKTEEAYLASFDHKTSHVWTIEAPYNEAGRITAYRDGHRANIGLLIAPDFRGQHYGSEAWLAVQNWLVDDGVTKIEAGCMESNEPMIKIFERAGLNLEGTCRAHFMLDGQPEDMKLYGRVY